MKFTRIYEYSGTSKKAGIYDYVTRYIAEETGDVIEVVYFMDHVSHYEFNGGSYGNLAMAKKACEDHAKEDKKEMMLSTAEISFEISESGMELSDVIKAVEKKYPAFKFSRTEGRYESCVMAIFELR